MKRQVYRRDNLYVERQYKLPDGNPEVYLVLSDGSCRFEQADHPLVQEALQFFEREVRV